MTTNTNEEYIEGFKKKFQHWDGIKVFCEPFLTEKEILVLEMRGQGKTLEEVGKAFRVTRERVRQIEAKANEKVRMKDYFVNWLNTVLCEKDKETALAVEQERERRNAVVKEYKEEGAMFILKVENGKTYEASMPIPKWAEVGEIVLRDTPQ